MTVDMIDACHRRHAFAVRLLLTSTASEWPLGTGRGLLAGPFAQGLLTHHYSLAIKGQHLNRLGMRLLLYLVRTGLGIKGIKVLSRGVDDLLDLALAYAHTGLGFDVIGDSPKGILDHLERHALLQPMRITMGRQIQLGIERKQARHPALAITGACHPNATKYTLIADLHMITLMGTNHAVQTAHRFFNPPGAPVIQMILQPQP